jgi:hypothetical protein
MTFSKVEDYVQNAKAITWDECHKIYVLMDDEQVEKMHEYGYEPIITSSEADSGHMLDLLKEWYNESCGLRFIEAVATNNDDPNAGFETLIPQVFED